MYTVFEQNISSLYAVMKILQIPFSTLCCSVCAAQNSYSQFLQLALSIQSPYTVFGL